MSMYDFILSDAPDWNRLSDSIIACSADKVKRVEYLTSVENITSDDEMISVVVYSIEGMGKYVIHGALCVMGSLEPVNHWGSDPAY